MPREIPQWRHHLETASMLSDTLAHSRAHQTLPASVSAQIRAAANQALTKASRLMPASTQAQLDERSHYNNVYTAVNPGCDRRGLIAPPPPAPPQHPQPKPESSHQQLTLS